MSGGFTSEDLARLSVAERALARAETMPEVLAVKTFAEPANVRGPGVADRARRRLDEERVAFRQGDLDLFGMKGSA